MTLADNIIHAESQRTVYVSQTRSYGKRALRRADSTTLLAGTVTEPRELPSVMGSTEEAWSELATRSQSVATHWYPPLLQPHPHTRDLIDRTLVYFENRYREDISVLSRAEDYQLPATLDHITDRSPAIQDRVLSTWNSLGAWIIKMRFQVHRQGEARCQTSPTTTIIAQVSEHWDHRSWYSITATALPRLCLVQRFFNRCTSPMLVHSSTIRLGSLAFGQSTMLMKSPCGHPDPRRRQTVESKASVVCTGDGSFGMVL